MSDKTGIEWTDATWNPVTGCTKVSAGCKNCYAERFAERWRGIPGHAFEQGFDLKLHPDRLEQPLRWKKPRRVFVCSMSDLFGANVGFDFVRQVFLTMQRAPHHTFQILTKRPHRMRRFIDEWQNGFNIVLPNVWLGTSVENQATADERVPHLLDTPAAVRFLSCEPLLGRVDLLRIKPWNAGHGPDGADSLRGGSWGHADVIAMAHGGPGYCNHSNAPTLDWVIVGGESGPGSRPMNPKWVRDIRDQCIASGVPFFFKQWGGTNKKKAGRELDGRTWDETPAERNGQ